MTGGLIEVHPSGINVVIRTISSLFIYLLIFFTKTFWLHKNINQTKTNYQNKNKQTLNNKGNYFFCRKTSKRGKLFILSFLRKIEIALITSFTILLILCTNLLFNFFFLLADFLQSLLVSIASSQQNIIKMKFILYDSNIP